MYGKGREQYSYMCEYRGAGAVTTTCYDKMSDSNHYMLCMGERTAITTCCVLGDRKKPLHAMNMGRDNHYMPVYRGRDSNHYMLCIGGGTAITTCSV